MNILFLSGYYPPKTKGGGEISTHLLASALVRLGHDVTVATDGDAMNDVLDGVKIIRRPLGLKEKPLIERIGAAKSALAINQAVDCAAFDFVHAHDFRAGLALSEMVRGGLIPARQAVVTVRDYAFVSGDSNAILDDGTIPESPDSIVSSWHSQRIAEVDRLSRKVGRFLQYALNVPYRKAALSRLPHRTYISTAQWQLIRRHVKAPNIAKVMYNPMGEDYLVHPTTAPRPNSVLFVGRIEKYKGVGQLLKAWQTITHHDRSARLTLVGDGAQFEHYQQVAKRLDIAESVEFRKHVPYDQMRELYDAHAVVVAPNAWVEPFGRAVAEAMARGRLVVAAKVGGPGEILTDGVTGLLHERKSLSDLTAKLLEAVNMSAEERARIGGAARDWVQRKLDPNEIARQYDDFYSEIRS